MISISLRSFDTQDLTRLLHLEARALWSRQLGHSTRALCVPRSTGGRMKSTWCNANFPQRTERKIANL